MKLLLYHNLDEIWFLFLLRTNLVTFVHLRMKDLVCFFKNEKFSLFCDSKLATFDSLSDYDNLYLIDITVSFNKSFQLSTWGTKRKLTSEDLGVIWHKRLRHISKKRIEGLVSDEILDPLDFTNFEVCVNCIYGEQANIRIFVANKTLDIL